MIVEEKSAGGGLARILSMAIVAVVTCIASAPLSLGAEKISIAQGYGRPPGDIGEPGEAPFAGEQPDSAQLLVRIGRLESQMRQISGQIEQMQFETRRLEEQLKKFQEDVDFRFHEGAPGTPTAKPPQKRSEAPEPKSLRTTGTSRKAPRPRAPARTGVATLSIRPKIPAPRGAPPARKLRPGREHEPGGRAPNESGPAGLDRNEPGAPLDLSNGRSRIAGPPPTTPTPPMAAAGVPASGITTPGGTVIAMAPNPAQEEFDIALGYFKQRAYENAEKGFAGFLEKNPKNKMASDAIYYLGESFYQRGRHPEAAEQYLKISTQYANSPRAPEALLRLGQSLNALGAKEQACATYGEIAPEISKCAGHGQDRRRTGGQARAMLMCDRPDAGRSPQSLRARRRRARSAKTSSRAPGKAGFSAGDIGALFSPWEAARGIVLGVSGGPDSVALMLLAAEWARGARPAAPALCRDRRPWIAQGLARRGRNGRPLGRRAGAAARHSGLGWRQAKIQNSGARPRGPL